MTQKTGKSPEFELIRGIGPKFPCAAVMYDGDGRKRVIGLRRWPTPEDEKVLAEMAKDWANYSGGGER